MSAPRFLADEDLRFEIVSAVRRLEPALLFETVLEAGIGGASDIEVLIHAHRAGLIAVSHDVNTMKGLAERRIREGLGISGLFLVPQRRRTRDAAESLVLVWSASQAEEWRDRIVYLPL